MGGVILFGIVAREVEVDQRGLLLQSLGKQADISIADVAVTHVEILQCSEFLQGFGKRFAHPTAIWTVAVSDEVAGEVEALQKRKAAKRRCHLKGLLRLHAHAFEVEDFERSQRLDASKKVAIELPEDKHSISKRDGVKSREFAARCREVKSKGNTTRI